MATLLVGFDSAWTRGKRGALVGVLSTGEGGGYSSLGPPQPSNFDEAHAKINLWRKLEGVNRTVILLDQPTIVVNDNGQRPVEHIVSSAVSRRKGGMQPSSKSRSEMFGEKAPVWNFLEHFDNEIDSQVLETYPVLAIMAQGWMRTNDTLPKYNPSRKKTFSIEDWAFLCGRTSVAFSEYGLGDLASWLDQLSRNGAPRKRDQDCLDACICLLVALHFESRKNGLIVGNKASGHIVVQHCTKLQSELEVRCTATNRIPSEWVKPFGIY